MKKENIILIIILCIFLLLIIFGFWPMGYGMMYGHFNYTWMWISMSVIGILITIFLVLGIIWFARHMQK
jgi:uncharacterized membrane protein